ncbi:hypothetical protein Tco_0647744 [Tanacetum coccineum]
MTHHYQWRWLWAKEGTSIDVAASDGMVKGVGYNLDGPMGVSPGLRGADFQHGLTQQGTNFYVEERGSKVDHLVIKRKESSSKKNEQKKERKKETGGTARKKESSRPQERKKESKKERSQKKERDLERFFPDENKPIGKTNLAVLIGVTVGVSPGLRGADFQQREGGEWRKNKSYECESVCV